MGVAEAQRRIDSREFAEWMAYDRIAPFIDERIELAIGRAACAIANSMPRKHAVKLDDVIWRPKPEAQTVDQQRAIFMQFAAAHNAAIQAKG